MHHLRLFVVGVVVAVEYYADVQTQFVVEDLIDFVIEYVEVETALQVVFGEQQKHYLIKLLAIDWSHMSRCPVIGLLGAYLNFLLYLYWLKMGSLEWVVMEVKKLAVAI